MKELLAIGKALGVSCEASYSLRGLFGQCIFFPEIRDVLDSWVFGSNNRIAGAYFHGIPGRGNSDFDRGFQRLCKRHERISRVQITNRRFREVILGSGIEPSKVHLIPIGVNLNYFTMQTPESRRVARSHYGIPQSALVVGSFQKDGQGWESGNEPKLLKGPDVFLKVIEILKTFTDDLFVFLSGPARGYVKLGLQHLQVPFEHHQVNEYPEVGRLFHCLDLYVISSREEGGPKAVLEAMASGVPLVSSRVGQAADLIKHGHNGWLADVGDAEALAHWSKHAIEGRSTLAPVIKAARRTAERHSYEALLPMWRDFLAGFVRPLD